MNRTVTDIVVHACFFALLWLGWIQGITGARNMVCFWIALKFSESLLMLSSRFAKVAVADGLTLPYNLLLLLCGFGVIGFFAWHGAFWLAAAHTFNTIVFIGLYSERRREKGIRA